jgi:hypothetical protein
MHPIRAASLAESSRRQKDSFDQTRLSNENSTLMLTATTVPLIVLLIVLWRLTRGKLLSIVLFLSMFEAASAINIAGSGVAPWIFALAIGICLKLLNGFTRPRFISGCNTTAVRLLLAFVGYAILTGIIYPLLFHGVPVTSAHSPGLSIPLSWGTANLFQLLYLVAMAGLYLLGLFSTRETLEAALNWYIWGCELMCAFAIYQLANAVLHIPYPSSVLYSNPSYVIYPAYKINGLWRLNSTATEASAMAGHLSVGIALQGWRVLAGPFRGRSFLSLLLLVVSLLFTQSSGGYLSLIFILTVGGVIYALYLIRCRWIPRTIGLGFIVLAMVGTVAFTTTSASSVVTKEIRSVLLEKHNTSSYRERTASDVAALQTARQTYLLGAGWGSLRCSGLGYLLIGTVGVPGLLLFSSFLAALFLPLVSRHSGATRTSMYARSLFAVAVSVFCLTIAGAEPVSPDLWVLFAVASAGPQIAKGLSSGGWRIHDHSWRLEM